MSASFLGMPVKARDEGIAKTGKKQRLEDKGRVFSSTEMPKKAVSGQSASSSAATTAAFNLSRANDDLRRSLARLSSGNRIVDSRDDPGGMSVAYKLNSRLKRTEAVRQNVQNGISYLLIQVW